MDKNNTVNNYYYKKIWVLDYVKLCVVHPIYKYHNTEFQQGYGN